MSGIGEAGRHAGGANLSGGWGGTYRAMVILSRWINTVSQYLILAVLLLMSLDITLRYIGVSPTKFGFEFVEYSLLWMSILPAAFQVHEKGHIAVDYIYDMFPAKLRTGSDFFALTCNALYSAIVTWFGFKMFWRSVELGTRTNTPMGIPVLWVEVWIPIAFGLMFLMCLFEMANLAVSSRRRPSGAVAASTAHQPGR